MLPPPRRWKRRGFRSERSEIQSLETVDSFAQRRGVRRARRSRLGRFAITGLVLELSAHCWVGLEPVQRIPFTSGSGSTPRPSPRSSVSRGFGVSGRASPRARTSSRYISRIARISARNCVDAFLTTAECNRLFEASYSRVAPPRRSTCKAHGPKPRGASAIRSQSRKASTASSRRHGPATSSQMATASTSALEYGVPCPGDWPDTMNVHAAGREPYQSSLIPSCNCRGS